MTNHDDIHGDILDFYYLKSSIKSLSLWFSLGSAAIIALMAYSYINYWGIPDSPEVFFSRIAFRSSLKLQLAVCIVAVFVIICSVISFFVRKSCYIAFTESTFYGKVPAFPLRTKEFEISYKDITVIKRAVKARRTSDFYFLIVKTKNETVVIPHTDSTKIRKIENLLYKMKEE